MVTYANGDFIKKCMMQEQKALHDEKVHKYVDRARLWQKRQLFNTTYPSIPMLPSFEELISSYSIYYVPSGKDLRQLYVKKAESELTPYQVSDNNRFKREIHAVGINQTFAQDHTFKVIKNYQSFVGSKAVWDVSNEIGEICTIVLVPSQSVGDFAHAGQQLLERKNVTKKLSCFVTITQIVMNFGIQSTKISQAN